MENLELRVKDALTSSVEATNAEMKRTAREKRRRAREEIYHVLASCGLLLTAMGDYDEEDGISPIYGVVNELPTGRRAYEQK